MTEALILAVEVVYDDLIDEYHDLGRIPVQERETARVLIAFDLVNTAVVLHELRPTFETALAVMVAKNEALRGVWVEA